MKNFSKLNMSSVLVTFFLLGVLITLGCWQVQRLQWKSVILNDIHKKMQSEPRSLNAVISDISVMPSEDINYISVKISGVFLHEYEMRVKPRTFKSKVGEHVITPMRLSDSTNTVLINRGFVEKGKDIEHPDGVVNLTGRLHTGFKKGYFRPENRPDKNEWYWLDIQAMKLKIGIDKMYNVLFYADMSNEKKALPIGGQLILKIPNNHFQYALFWFGMAFVLLGVFVVYHIEPKKET